MNMQPLFGAQGRRALRRVLRKEPLLAFDFDGTLSPIVDRPSEARMAPGIAERLDRLSRLRPVAVVTGRSVEDVSRRLGFAPQFVVGSHGAEDPASDAPLDMTALDEVRAQLDAHRGTLEAAGVHTEDKGYSLALHYRNATDRQAALAAIGGFAARLDPRLRGVGGKSVFNIVLAGAPDKGDAVQTLVRRSGSDGAVFVGDDLNDEAVFERAGPDWVTVRIGADDHRSRAAFYLERLADMNVLLDIMLSLLQPS